MSNRKLKVTRLSIPVKMKQAQFARLNDPSTESKTRLSITPFEMEDYRTIGSRKELNRLPKN